MKDEKLVKILLVDDRAENLYALQVILASEHYLCVKASSGPEALQILRREQDFAIILMDVQMPIMDGFETVERIRKIKKLQNIPIIFLTVNMDTAVLIFKGYQAGAVDYLTKPLSPEILRAKVAVFVDLYKKNHELLVQKEQMKTLNGELTLANKELAFQNEEKEKRAAELSIANRELLAFTYISSHDLQEPLRKIQNFVTIILANDRKNLSESGKYNFQRMQLAAGRMQQLIEDLLAFSRLNNTERKFVKTDLNLLIEEVKAELKDTIDEKEATIEAFELRPVLTVAFQFRQLIYNLISNSLKFSRVDIPLRVIIKSKIIKGREFNSSSNCRNHEKLIPEKEYCHITVKDNGIGFEPQFSERIFEVFQRLHNKEIYLGTGIGLAIVKKIVENHNGIIMATSQVNKGATFDIYIPAHDKGNNDKQKNVPVKLPRSTRKPRGYKEVLV